MAVTIKSPREIELMREAGRILAKTHEELAKNLRPGMSTWDIDHMGEEIIRSYGCIPSFKNYNGYPGSICVSVNDEVVHGIPSRTRVLKEGDIVSFFEGIKFAKAGNHLNDISAAIQKYAESFGFGVVRDLVGHGIGSHLHEDPEIPNFARKRKGILLQPGMTLAIEPMITEGSYEVVWLDDDWTVMTEDGGWAAHYENTILITEGEPEILSL